MKKAFDANVSRSKPRVRLGSLTGVEEIAQQVAGENTAPRPPPIAAPPPEHIHEAAHVGVEHEHDDSPPRMSALPPPQYHDEHDDAEERRERLRERLRRAREGAAPGPLPDTVAETGQLAVQRITVLQQELTQVKAQNAALAQELDGTRRQAERAVREARVRSDEAKRLGQEIEGRSKLLVELEGELKALEAERDEALLALQAARESSEHQAAHIEELTRKLGDAQAESDASLAEEERLVAELDARQVELTHIRAASEALQNERDAFAQKVTELSREREDLLDARRALEAVHRALSSAVPD